MNRRKALSIAGTVTATVVGGTLAVAANVGLLGFSRAEAPSLGVIEANTPATTPTSSAPQIVTREEDVYVPERPAPSGKARATTSTTAAPTAASTAELPSATTSTGGAHEDDGRDEHHSGDGVVEGLRDDD